MSLPGVLVRWRARWVAQGGNRASYGGLLQADDVLTSYDALGLALALYQLHSSGQYPLNAWVSELWTLEELRVLALGPPQLGATAGAGTISGTVSGVPLPPSSAFGVLHQAETTWKGGHPMWRVPGVTTDQVQVGATARLTEAVAQGVGLAAAAMISAMSEPGFAGDRHYLPGVLLQGKHDEPDPPGPDFSLIIGSRCQPVLSTVRRRNRS